MFSLGSCMLRGGKLLGMNVAHVLQDPGPLLEQKEVIYPSCQHHPT